MAEPTIKLRLFRAPYVDGDGVARERVCGFVFGLDPEGESDREVVDQIADALKRCEEQASAIAVNADIDVSWL